MTSSITQHQRYLLQGIMNFFMDHGKVALVAFENVATQEEFERTLAHQAPAYLGCEIIPLHAGENEDVLQTFNALLARISLQQATQATDVAHANYLLWVSENEHFTPELLQLLKKIILQLSGLQLKLYISVTSDRWNQHLFDIAGRKIAYWFIPASSPTPDLTAPQMAATLQASESTTAQPMAAMTQTAATLPAIPSVRSRSLRPWVSAIGVLVFLAAAAYGLRDNKAPPGPHTAAKTEATDTNATKPETAPTAEKEAKASDAQRPSPPAAVTANSTNKSAAPVAATAAAVSEAASTTPPATQTLVINSQADCPSGTENLPTARPSRFIKDTNYIFIKSPQSLRICVAAAGSAYRLVNLSANKGIRIYGISPWRVYSPDLRRVELYFQGARVVLAPSVNDQVQVVPR